MSTYRKIHGRSIQAVTTDPTGDITEGQVWYNTTSDTFKSVVSTSAWAFSSYVLHQRVVANLSCSQSMDNVTLSGGVWSSTLRQLFLTKHGQCDTA